MVCFSALLNSSRVDNITTDLVGLGRGGGSVGGLGNCTGLHIKGFVGVVERVDTRSYMFTNSLCFDCVIKVTQ